MYLSLFYLDSFSTIMVKRKPSRRKCAVRTPSHQEHIDRAHQRQLRGHITGLNRVFPRMDYLVHSPCLELFGNPNLSKF